MKLISDLWTWLHPQERTLKVVRVVGIAFRAERRAWVISVVSFHFYLSVLCLTSYLCYICSWVCFFSLCAPSVSGVWNSFPCSLPAVFKPPSFLSVPDHLTCKSSSALFCLCCGSLVWLLCSEKSKSNGLLSFPGVGSWISSEGCL